MKVYLVPLEDVNLWWPKVTEHLNRAVVQQDKVDIHDVYLDVVVNGHSLWIVLDANMELRGAAVTVVLTYPKSTCLFIEYLGGEDGPEWKEAMISMLKEWAKANNCRTIEFEGRPGWGRVLKQDGVKVKYEVFEIPVAYEKD